MTRKRMYNQPQTHTHWLEAPRTDWGPLRLLHRPAKDKTTRAPVLFFHGALSSAAQFDVPVSGMSWLGHMADQGRDAWALDLPGHGGSWLPAFDHQSDQASPAPRATDTPAAVQAALDVIGRPAVLVGHSWGGTVAAMGSMSAPDRTKALVLIAPPYLPEQPDRDLPRGAWRDMPLATIRRRWDMEIPTKDKTVFRDPAVMDAFFRVLADPCGNRPGRDVVRFPTGPFADYAGIVAGDPTYDPTGILRPTLLVRGANDPVAVEDDQRNFFYLIGSADKRYVTIPNGTHFMPLERSAPQLFAAVDTFINEFD